MMGTILVSQSLIKGEQRSTNFASVIYTGGAPGACVGAAGVESSIDFFVLLSPGVWKFVGISLFGLLGGGRFEDVEVGAGVGEYSGVEVVGRVTAAGAELWLLFENVLALFDLVVALVHLALEL